MTTESLPRDHVFDTVPITESSFLPIFGRFWMDLDYTGFAAMLGLPMDQDEPVEEQIELRLHVSRGESDGVMAICGSFQGIVTKKAAARLLILYGLEHIESVLAWYSQRVVDAVRQTRPR